MKGGRREKRGGRGRLEAGGENGHAECWKNEYRRRRGYRRRRREGMTTLWNAVNCVSSLRAGEKHVTAGAVAAAVVAVR